MHLKRHATTARHISAVYVISAVLLAAGIAPEIAAHADALSDLRTTLSKLSDQSPLEATVDVKWSNVNKKENSGKPQSATVLFDIELGSGLRMHFSSASLQQADTELQAAIGDADHPTPTVALLGNDVDPLTMEHLLTRGPALLRLLANASAATVSETTLWGQPARELLVQLPQPKSKDVSLKDYQRTVSIWLNADGVPLAFTDHSQFKACLLFLCATTDSTESDRLDVVNGRLVATLVSRDQKLSGLGQNTDSHIVYTLIVQAAKPATKAAGASSIQ
ncbi:MAG TPA: hypothetical protein VJR90_09205 [Gammaproteobacteria bacterium]|nr:hypothetical protein [Gammaproteobacteria bacterium]